MSRIELEARAVLLRRRDAIARGPVAAAVGDPAASWRDWESQAEARTQDLGRELAEIEAALRRIEEGSYGSCTACGGPMGLQRLRALPEARYCIACSGHREE